MLKKIMFIALMCYSVTGCLAQSSYISKTSLIADCDSLQQYLLTHPDVTWLNAKAGENIQKGIKELKEQINNAAFIDDAHMDKLRTKLLSIVSELEDGHSGFLDMEALFGRLPVNIAGFADGYFIISADEEYKELLGAKVLEVGKYPVQKALEILWQVEATPNTSARRITGNVFLSRPGILYGLGIIADRNAADFKLQLSNGEKKSVILPRVQQLRAPITFLSNQKIELPLYLQNRDKNYWYKLLDGGTVYMGYNSVTNMQEKNFQVFCNELDSFLKASNAKRLVVDARLNGGGDNFLNTFLIKTIRNNPSINRKGNLYLITGYRTFSAAINLYGDMENSTEVIIAGEPAGDAMQFPGDARTFQLPGFGVGLRVSQLMWVIAFDHDKRKESRVDMPVYLKFEEYKLGKDPVLEKILAQPLALQTTQVNPINLKPQGYQTTEEYVEFKKDANGIWQVILPGKIYLQLIKKMGTRLQTSNPYITVLDEPTPALEFNYTGKLLKYNLMPATVSNRLVMQPKSSLKVIPYSLYGNNLTQRAYKMFLLEGDRNSAKAYLDYAIEINKRPEMAIRALQRLKN